MNIQRATVSDAKEILALQIMAFKSQAELYNDYALPPLLQTVEDIKKEFESKVILKAVIDSKIIGSVRAFVTGGTCHLSKLIVHPDFHNQGVGTKLMIKIEALFRQCDRFELFTGHKDPKNIYLYEKLGYKKFKAEKIRDGLILIYFEKTTIS